MGRQVTQRLKGLERKAAAILITREPLPQNPRLDRLVTLLCVGLDVSAKEAGQTIRQSGLVDQPDDILDVVIQNLEIISRDKGINAAANEDIAPCA